MEAVQGETVKRRHGNTRDAEKIVPGKISIRYEMVLMLLSTLLLHTRLVSYCMFLKFNLSYMQILILKIIYSFGFTYIVANFRSV